MLWIDWLYLDWQEVSAWIFGILLAIYIAIRLKNYFFRWSTSSPQFLQPYEIQQERLSQRGMEQTKITVEGEGEKQPPVVIWVNGKCPRFLRNIAYGLTLHVKTVYVNEVKPHINSLPQLEIDKIDANTIFYKNASQFMNVIQDPPQNRIIILLAPIIQKSLNNDPKVKKYLILGRGMKSKKVQTLEQEGLIIINLRGGHHFRGWEFALLGELITIFNKNKGLV